MLPDFFDYKLSLRNL